jgi:hypothetical protein
VGAIMAALKASGVDDNTLVVVSGDNGPWETKCNLTGSAGPFTGLWQKNEGACFASFTTTHCCSSPPPPQPLLTATLNSLFTGHNHYHHALLATAHFLPYPPSSLSLTVHRHALLTTTTTTTHQPHHTSPPPSTLALRTITPTPRSSQPPMAHDFHALSLQVAVGRRPRRHFGREGTAW